jgi:hypothetical protein
MRKVGKSLGQTEVATDATERKYPHHQEKWGVPTLVGGAKVASPTYTPTQIDPFPPNETQSASNPITPYAHEATYDNELNSETTHPDGCTGPWHRYSVFASKQMVSFQWIAA